MFDWQFPEAEESDVFYLEDVTLGGRSGVEWRELGPHGVGALHQHPEVPQRKPVLLQRVHEVVLGEGPGHRVPVLVELQDRDDVLPGLNVKIFDNTSENIWRPKNICSCHLDLPNICICIAWLTHLAADAGLHGLRDVILWHIKQQNMRWHWLCLKYNTSVGGKHEQGSEAFTDHLFHLRHSAPVAPICPSKKQKCKCAMFIQKHYTFSYLCHFN